MCFLPACSLAWLGPDSQQLSSRWPVRGGSSRSYATWSPRLLRLLQEQTRGSCKTPRRGLCHLCPIPLTRTQLHGPQATCLVCSGGGNELVPLASPLLCRPPFCPCCLPHGHISAPAVSTWTCGCSPFPSDGLPQSRGSIFLFCGPHHLLLKILQRCDSCALGILSILYLNNDRRTLVAGPSGPLCSHFPPPSSTPEATSSLRFPK